MESNDDVIDLEGLVQNIDLTPTGDVLKAQPREAPVAPTAPLHAEALSHDQIDAILVEEDPEMAARIDEIRAVAAESPSENDVSEVQDDLPSEKNVSFRQWTFQQWIGLQFLKVGTLVRALRDLTLRLLKDSKGVLRELAIRAKISVVAKARTWKSRWVGVFAWIRARSATQKLALALALLTLVGLGFVVSRTLDGTLLPAAEKVWVANFAEHADDVFTYSPDGAFEDFNDPLLHPEFVVLIDRVVVNLSRSPEASENANPMAAFELYLQTDNQATAVEIKDRDVEVRDAIARSVERMTYPELADEEGKTKLKLLIRKELNEKLTLGKVRRVFFKTLVLNPE